MTSVLWLTCLLSTLMIKKNLLCRLNELQNPQAKEHLAEAFKLSLPDPHLYEVVSIHHRSQ